MKILFRTLPLVGLHFRMNFKWLLYLSFSVFGLISCGNNEKKNQNDTKNQKEITHELDEAIQSDPKNASLYVKRATLYHKIAEDSLAIVDLKKAIQLDSTKAAYHSFIGQILFDHKDISGSARYFQKALELNPSDEVSHLKLAHLFLFSGEYPKAFIEINNVLRANVYNAEAYFLKGMCYKNMKDTNRAISSFQTAVQTDPKYADAYLQLALLFEAKKDPLAIRYYENAYNANPTDFEPLYGEGMYWQNQNEYEEAKKVYHRILLHNNNFPKAYYNLGWMLLQQDSTEKAYRQFDLAVKVQPDYADAWYNRGLCSEILGKKKEALSDYEQALTFAPKTPYILQALERVKGSVQ